MLCDGQHVMLCKKCVITSITWSITCNTPYCMHYTLCYLCISCSIILLHAPLHANYMINYMPLHAALSYYMLHYMPITWSITWFIICDYMQHHSISCSITWQLHDQLHDSLHSTYSTTYHYMHCMAWNFLGLWPRVSFARVCRLPHPRSPPP